MNSPKKRILLLADDHSVVRNGFRMILNAQEDLEVVGEAANGREAVARALELQPGIIVMDGTMPELNGIEATRCICESAPRVRILALSMHKDGVHVREILRVGRGEGFLLPPSPTQCSRTTASRSPTRLTSSPRGNARCFSGSSRAHRGRIMEKLNLHSTGELVRFAVRNGIID